MLQPVWGQAVSVFVEAAGAGWAALVSLLEKPTPVRLVAGCTPRLSNRAVDHLDRPARLTWWSLCGEDAFQVAPGFDHGTLQKQSWESPPIPGAGQTGQACPLFDAEGRDHCRGIRRCPSLAIDLFIPPHSRNRPRPLTYEPKISSQEQSSPTMADYNNSTTASSGASSWGTDLSRGVS